jgi:hypothetical protein
MSNKGEDVYVKNIENAIRAIKNRAKSPAEAKAGINFKLLKEVNEPMYDKLMAEYKAVVSEFNTK